MSEIALNPLNAMRVASVEPDSPAAAARIAPGDLLRAIDGHPILDILDYRFHSAGARLNLELERDGAAFAARLRKRPEEDAGLTFDSDLGDRVHTCNNHCVFCFIHQMPKRMRRSLYLMDDDFRLSFMHGNYVTLTNLSDVEWRRILDQRLSPLYVSVHATDPELRGMLLGRKEPAPILPQLAELADNGIDVHAQVVLCPGLNDGATLHRTIVELARLHPTFTGRRAGVESVAIVPVGLTRFRERLAHVDFVESDYARKMIPAIARIGLAMRRTLGTRFAWLADEWYFLAGVDADGRMEAPFPSRAHYEQFPQLDDGVGTMRLFLDRTKRLAARLPAASTVPVEATLVTAEMAAPAIRQLAQRFSAIENVSVNVCVVQNRFFGGDIRVAGLLTAQDVREQIQSFQDCRQTVFLPKICLRDGALFLDDVTVDDLRRETGLDVRVVDPSPSSLAADLGLVRNPQLKSTHG